MIEDSIDVIFGCTDDCMKRFADDLDHCYDDRINVEECQCDCHSVVLMNPKRTMGYYPLPVLITGYYKCFGHYDNNDNNCVIPKHYDRLLLKKNETFPKSMLCNHRLVWVLIEVHVR